MEKSMQPQVQSEQDKMVPIDTSGDAVEIELKEEIKQEEQELTDLLRKTELEDD